jgi:hypothetical protein
MVMSMMTTLTTMLYTIMAGTLTTTTRMHRLLSTPMLSTTMMRGMDMSMTMRSTQT